MELLSLRSERAIVSAAHELSVDPLALANALQNGRLAQLVLELRIAERRLSGASAERLARLLASLPQAEREGGIGAEPLPPTARRAASTQTDCRPGCRNQQLLKNREGQPACLLQDRPLDLVPTGVIPRCVEELVASPS